MSKGAVTIAVGVPLAFYAPATLLGNVFVGGASAGGLAGTYEWIDTGQVSAGTVVTGTAAGALFGGLLYGTGVVATKLLAPKVGGTDSVLVYRGTNSAGPFSPIVEGGGLQAHENAGGHLLSKHVGQTEQQLMDRLVAQVNISGSSSFYNRAIAESAVSQALDVNQVALTNWLSGSTPRLRIDHIFPDNVGISVIRGATSATNVNAARIILVRDPSMPTGYKILTGFPTP